MSALTGICITLGCCIVGLAIAVLIEERNQQRRAIQAARAEQKRRWAEMIAIAKLMHDKRDAMFDEAQNYEMYEDWRNGND